MTEHLPYVVMLLGGTTIAAIMAHAICRWLRIPGLVGYILIGVALAVIDGHGQLMTAKTDVVFEFLGGIGIVALLFRVGLESNITEMVGQLRRAIWLWVGNVGLRV